jgi:hypothetical protein
MYNANLRGKAKLIHRRTATKIWYVDIDESHILTIFHEEIIVIKLSFQQMHYLLKHKMLQFIFKCFFIQLLHVSVPLDHLQGAHIRTLLKLQFL